MDAQANEASVRRALGKKVGQKRGQIYFPLITMRAGSPSRSETDSFADALLDFENERFAPRADCAVAMHLAVLYDVQPKVLIQALSGAIAGWAGDLGVSSKDLKRAARGLIRLRRRAEFELGRGHPQLDAT
jgi:hypothetical protein